MSEAIKPMNLLAVAYDIGWSEGAIDASRAHAPATNPTDRLIWVLKVKQTEPNLYT